MKFLEGAPIFAVEVRSEGDYGLEAEEVIARKRADYFAAGTLVVWDVDLLSEEVVKVYRASPLLPHRAARLAALVVACRRASPITEWRRPARGR